MYNCVVLLGYSGCGKDHVAKTLWPDYYNYKINQSFKDVFELDHGLKPGTCNNKSQRSHVLKKGPCAGLTIQEAMVRAFDESQDTDPWAYGYKFKVLPISPPHKNCVITDLRKLTEAVKLTALPYRHSMCVIRNKYVRYKYSSDQQLEELVQWYRAQGFRVWELNNDYDSSQMADTNS